MKRNAALTGSRSHALCLSCGLCCDSSVFGQVRLRPEEVPWAVGHRLPLVTDRDETSFKQPCALLQTQADRRVCRDYVNRPAACRAFSCKLMREYEAGRTTAEEAARLIARTRGLSERIGERTGEPSDPEALLDFGELRAAIRRYFFAPP